MHDVVKRRQSKKGVSREDWGRWLWDYRVCLLFEARANALWPDGGKLALDPVVV